MKRPRTPLPETIALARGRKADPERELSTDAIIARQMAQRLFAALKARTGMEVDALLDHNARQVVCPVFDAADRLYRKQRIYCEPVARSFFASLFDDPVIYSIHYPDGTQRAVSEDELLAMAGMGRGA